MKKALVAITLLLTHQSTTTLEAKIEGHKKSSLLKTGKNSPIKKNQDKLMLQIEKVSATQKGQVLKAVIDSLVNEEEIATLTISAKLFSIEITKTKFQDIFSVSFISEKNDYNKAFLTRSSTLLGLIEGQIDKFSHNQTISELETEEEKTTNSNRLLNGIVIGSLGCLAIFILLKYAKNKLKTGQFS